MKFLTFPYAGREPKTIEALLKTRPELKSLYIYDINLTTGTLLYSCKGGIGVTTERYMVEMHKFIKSPTYVSTLKGTFKHYFGDKFYRRKFLALQEKFNNQTTKLQNYRQCAELYLLWCGSNYTHRYRERGYYGHFYPSKIDWRLLQNASRLSREKNLLYERGDFFSLREGIINENVVIYCHLPSSYGAYGSGFIWTAEKLQRYIANLLEFHSLGYKVCISTRFLEQCAIYSEYKSQFKSAFQYISISEFKVSNTTNGQFYSDTYFFNF